MYALGMRKNEINTKKQMSRKRERKDAVEAFKKTTSFLGIRTHYSFILACAVVYLRVYGLLSLDR